MMPFKFFKGNPYTNRTINPNLYSFVELANPYRDAVVNAVNICHGQNIRYRDYEHYFTVEGTQMKLKIMEVRSYRNPVQPFFKIRYTTCLSTMIMDDNPIFTEMRLNEEQYNRLIFQAPHRENI